MIKMTKCIICSTEQSLNTSMTFPIGDDDYEVWLCDEHADDTTPKTAREALEGKVSALEEYKEKMAEMGFELKEADSGLLLPVAVEQPAAAEVKGKFVCACGKSIKSKSGLKMHQKGCKVYAEKKVEEPDGDHYEIVKPPPPIVEAEYLPVVANIDAEAEVVETEVVSKARIIRKGGLSVNQNRAKTVGRVKGVGGYAEGHGQGSQVESHDSYDVNEIIKETISSLGDDDVAPNRISPNQEITEMQEIADPKTGAIMVVPKRIESDMGTTLISIVDTGGDKAIQDRAREQALLSKSMNNQQWHSQNDYDSTRTIKCSLCRGSGVTRIGNKVCPKCHGGGVLQ